MLRVLDPVLDKWVVVYLDDLLIYSKTKREHLQHLRSVLALFRKNGLYPKLSKCSFMQDETEFLGHTITKDGIKTSDGLTKATREWPTPKSTKEIQQFLGLAQFYPTVRIPFCRHCPPSFLPPRQQHPIHMDRHTTVSIPPSQTSHLLCPRPPHLGPRPRHHRRHRCIQFRHWWSAAADGPIIPLLSLPGRCKQPNGTTPPMSKNC